MSMESTTTNRPDEMATEQSSDHEKNHLQSENDTNDSTAEPPKPPSKERNGNQRERRSDQWTPRPPLVVEPISPDATNTSFQPFMLLLAGLPGCGKSTFARTLVDAMPFKFARVNQDEMKSRNECITHAKSFMSRGLCLIVDRCNFNWEQRRVWYDLAREHNYVVDCIVFQVPVAICIQRCIERPSHETISKDEAPRIVRMVRDQWQMPTLDDQKQQVGKHKKNKSKSKTKTKQPQQPQKEQHGNNNSSSNSLRTLKISKSLEQIDTALLQILHQKL